MGRMNMKSTRRVLSHSPVRSLFRSHRSLIYGPLRSFVCSLAHSLASELMEKRFTSLKLMCRFHIISTHSGSCPPFNSSHPASLSLSFSLFNSIHCHLHFFATFPFRRRFFIGRPPCRRPSRRVVFIFSPSICDFHDISERKVPFFRSFCVT